jgi:putative sterol carrier protein
MGYQFPTPEWLQALGDKLNADEQYGKIASKWEGDLCFIIEPDDGLPEEVIYYLDLWHGTCRGTDILGGEQDKKAAFTLKAPFQTWSRILDGDLHPMQAMLTQKLKLKGNMAYMMRHVPTVLDFTRCAQEISA